jgi:hypothetical protein
MADVVQLRPTGDQPFEAPIADAATGTVDGGQVGRFWLPLRLRALAAERDALLAAFKRVTDGDVERIENEIAALRRQLWKG